MLRAVLVLLILSSVAHADDPVKPVLVFPTMPTPAVVDPTPTPSPAPVNAVPLLVPGQLYVVQSEEEFFLLASPAALATTTYETGPIKIRGVFTDGNGKSETRTFESKYIAIVDPTEGASGRIELLGVPVGLKRESDIFRVLIDIGVAPRPPPPGPVDPPGPTPTPAPTGFRALFIYESTAKLTREQLNTLHSTQITKYLNDHCVKGPSGLAEWRKWSLKTEVLATESRTMSELWNAIDKTKIADKLPQLVIAVNGAAQTFPLPPTEAETLALLKKFGGE